MIFDVDCDVISVRVGVFGLIFKNALSDLILDHASNKGVLLRKVRFRSTFRLVGFFKIRQFLLITPNFLTFQLHFLRFRWGFFMIKARFFSQDLSFLGLSLLYGRRISKIKMATFLRPRSVDFLNFSPIEFFIF